MCWTANFFIKEAADPAFVSRHQDSTYWGLSTPDVVTAWVAFTPATEANRAMELRPGSHKLDQIPHRDTFAKHNLLTRGQEVMVEVDNRSNDRHIGFAIRYIPTSVAPLAGEDSASLVRGEDRHHHFMAEPQPTRDLDPEFVALHRTITERLPDGEDSRRCFCVPGKYHRKGLQETPISANRLRRVREAPLQVVLRVFRGSG